MIIIILRSSTDSHEVRVCVNFQQETYARLQDTDGDGPAADTPHESHLQQQLERGLRTRGARLQQCYRWPKDTLRGRLKILYDSILYNSDNILTRATHNNSWNVVYGLRYSLPIVPGTLGTFSITCDKDKIT